MRFNFSYRLIEFTICNKYLFLPLFQIDNHDTVEMGSDAEIKWISHLLELSEDWLKQALTQKVTVRKPNLNNINS